LCKVFQVKGLRRLSRIAMKVFCPDYRPKTERFAVSGHNVRIFVRIGGGTPVGGCDPDMMSGFLSGSVVQLPIAIEGR